MAWTVRVVAKRDVAGKGHVDVIYMNGTQQIPETLTVDFANASIVWLKGYLRAQLAKLDQIDAFIGLVPTDTNVDYDVSAGAPSAYDLALETFKADCIYVRRADKAVRAGVFTGTEPVIVDTRARIKAIMITHSSDPEYQAILDFLP
jgi:hypothetical protein